MRSLTAFVAILIIAFLQACSSSDEGQGNSSDRFSRKASVFDSGPQEFEHSQFSPSLLQGDLAVEEDQAFGILAPLAVRGRKMWIGDRKGDPFVHEVDLVSGRVVRSIGRRGEGPGDFKTVVDLSFRPGDSSGVWAYDFTLGRLTRIGPSGEGREKVRTIKPSEASLRPLLLHWLAPNLILGVSTVGDPQLAFLDSLGTVRSRVPLAILGGDSIPLASRRSISTGVRVCAAPETQTFALQFLMAGRIDLYDFKGRLLRRFEVPIPSNGDFERDSLGKWQSYAHRRYYLDCAATPRYLYAYFSGRLEPRFEAGSGFEGVYVHVFTWDGHLVRIVRLQHDGLSLAVDGDSSLFTASLLTPRVFRYHLPK